MRGMNWDLIQRATTLKRKISDQSKYYGEVDNDLVDELIEVLGRMTPKENKTFRLNE